MGRYAFQARDNRGELASGTIAAETLEEASQMLRGQGKFIIRLTATKEAAAAPAADANPTGGKVKRTDVIFFAHQMAVMLETGVPISEALECVAEQAINPPFKAVLRDVAATVQGGVEFSTALRKYPKVFPTIMTSLVKASEASGTMGTMMDQISRYLAKEEQTYKQVKGAMMYPMFMVVMAVSVTIFLLWFVLPKFATIYAAKGAALPGPTRLLMFLSDSLVSGWMYWLGGVIAIVAGIWATLRTPTGRRLADWLKLNTPIIGGLFRQLYLTRATRTMGAMISAGVSMLDMIALVKQVTANVFFEDLWDEVDERLRQGSQLSDPLFASNLIPRSVAQMIHSGEKAGRLSQVLMRVAAYTEIEFDDAVKRTTQFIEPLMIGVMGGVIGFVAISLLLPIFQVGKVMTGK